MPLEIPISLAWAHPVTAEWFLNKFVAVPPSHRNKGWPSILTGDATLISAPTGSGKTFSAFLVLFFDFSTPARVTQSPGLVPVAHPLASRLRQPAQGPLERHSEKISTVHSLRFNVSLSNRGFLCPEIRTGVRTGDTLSKERAAMLRNPPAHPRHYAGVTLHRLLTAGQIPREPPPRPYRYRRRNPRRSRRQAEGAHLALSLERLDALVTGANRLSPGAYLAGLCHATAANPAFPPHKIPLRS